MLKKKGEDAFQNVEFWKKLLLWNFQNKKNELTKSGRKKDLLFFVGELVYQMIHLTNVDLVTEWRKWISIKWKLNENQNGNLVKIIDNVLQMYFKKINEENN